MKVDPQVSTVAVVTPVEQIDLERWFASSTDGWAHAHVGNAVVQTGALQTLDADCKNA